MTKLEKLELELKEMLKENSIKNQSKGLFNECGFQYKKKTKQNDWKEFDKWMDNLGEKNGYTEY